MPHRQSVEDVAVGSPLRHQSIHQRHETLVVGGFEQVKRVRCPVGKGGSGEARRRSSAGEHGASGDLHELSSVGVHAVSS